MSDKKYRSLKLNEYDIGDIIKIFPLGRMKVARSRRTNELIVIKMLNKSKIINSKQLPHISNEFNILPNLVHPSIISFLNSTHDEKYIYFAFEFISGGDLFTLLKVENNLSLEKAQFYAGQIVFVLDYLHSKNIIYRNLKPENILINKNGYIKIADFQLAKVIGDRTYTMCGTPGYMAPEIILNKGYGLSVDWWAFGIVLYEMICGIDPFSDEEPLKIYENILTGKIKFSSDFDDKSKSLIKHLLEPDLSKRYGNLNNGVDDIKNHAFFRSMNWDKLLRQEIEPPFIPKIKDNDLKYYNVYPDIDDNAESYNKGNDPFSDWFN
jgi:serine/threonine protein kinase